MVVESCYLYCYAIRNLIVDNLSKREAYEKIQEEANRRARVSGFSTIKYWIENDVDVNDIDEMPKPNYRPISYIKTSILWAFYYLKNDFEYEDAL
jgi:hypothetical protein